MKMRIWQTQWRKWVKTSSRFKKSIGATWAKLSRIETVATSDSGPLEIRKPKPRSFLNPLFWIQQFVLFVVRYVQSRSLTAFIHGMPVLMAIGIAIGGYYWTRPNQSRIVDSLKTKRNMAVEAEQFETADFYARKLCFLKKNDSESLFARAILFDQFDRLDEARLMAFQLANEKDHLPALEWLCQKDLEDLQAAAGDGEKSKHEAMIRRMQTLVSRSGSNPRAHIILGSAFMLLKDYTRAEPEIQRAIDLVNVPVPELNWSLSVIADQRGDKLLARNQAAFAANGFLKKYSQQSQKDDLKLVLQTVKSLVRAEREQEAVQLLKGRIRIGDKDKQSTVQFQYLLAEVYALWAKRIRSKPNATIESLAQSLQHLKAGMAVNPNHPTVLEELSRLACSDEGSELVSEESLNQLLDSGISPGLIHFIIGTRRANENPDSQKDAIRHLELAMKHSPAFPGLLNNLADSLAKHDDSDIPQALKLINMAIEAMPHQPYFYDTRGNIYTKMKKYDEAIADLERALAAPELRPRVHDKLANVYEKLGQAQESERHRRLGSGNNTGN